MNRWLDWYVFSLGISDRLINFWDESIKNKMTVEAIKKNDMVVVEIIFFSLFLDGQSLRVRGPAINWWLFFFIGRTL